MRGIYLCRPWTDNHAPLTTLPQVLGVMVMDGGGAHGMEVVEEEEFEHDGPGDGPASQGAATAKAATPSSTASSAATAAGRATHCPACGDCFCEKGPAALAQHKRNCKPTYTFTQQGDLGVELVFKRTAGREVSGSSGNCGPVRVLRFACPWCPPGTRTYLLGGHLGEHLRKSCAAAKQQKFVLPTPASMQPTTAASVPQSDRRKRGRGKVRACVCVSVYCVRLLC